MTRCVLFNNVDESIFKINGRTIYSARPIAIIEYKRVKKKKKPRLLLVLKIFVLLFIFIFYDFFFFCVRSMVNFVFQCTKCSTTTWKKKKMHNVKFEWTFREKATVFREYFRVSRSVKKTFPELYNFSRKDRFHRLATACIYFALLDIRIRNFLFFITFA